MRFAVVKFSTSVYYDQFTCNLLLLVNSLPVKRKKIRPILIQTMFCTDNVSRIRNFFWISENKIVFYYHYWFSWKVWCNVCSVTQRFLIYCKPFVATTVGIIQFIYFSLQIALLFFFSYYSRYEGQLLQLYMLKLRLVSTHFLKQP